MSPSLGRRRTRHLRLLVPLGLPTGDRARRVQNGMVDEYPTLIARCSVTADVVAAVNFAREQDFRDENP